MRALIPWAIPLLLVSLSPTRAAAEPRWYKGDLHAHSLHSDGDSSVADILAVAEAAGLDFFALTDHDSSMGGEPTHWADPDYRSDTMILLYGIEWTTGVGHANLWAPAPFDYRPLWLANYAEDPVAAADAAHAAGALFSINHPTNFSCCPWDPEEGMNDTVEVWNGVHRTVTWDYGAVRHFWEGTLREGSAVGIVGGSDMHDLNGAAPIFFTVGNPTTWVYASEPTPAGILEAIGAGRVSISYGPDAPRVELWADGGRDGGFDVVMGEVLAPGRARLEVRLGDGEGRVRELPLATTAAFFGETKRPSDMARLDRLTEATACGETYLIGIYEGPDLLKTARLECGGTWQVDVDAKPGSWYRAEVFGRVQAGPVQQLAYGRYVALTNAIRVGE